VNERIRIDRGEALRAPASAAMRGPAPQQQAGDGTVFGHVGPSAVSMDRRGIWARPKMLLGLAGAVAALLVWLLVDGALGYWRYEEAGTEPPWSVSILFMPGFCALLAACIASADDFASGSFGRGAIFAGVGMIGGAVGGVIAQIAGGIVMAVIGSISGLDEASSMSELLFLAMLARVPAWTVAGALVGTVCGALGRSGRRVLLGAVGGAAGGFAGGLVFDPVNFMLTSDDGDGHAAVSRLLGLVCVGTVSGVAIAFAEDAAKSAWLVIERGRLIGKQFIIYRNPTWIGAAYSNDVFLFKDPTVQQEHAHIVRRAGQFAVEAQGGSLVKVNGRTVASARISGNDVIQIGETVLRFMTKAKDA
jgi:hypothetical protein